MSIATALVEAIDLPLMQRKAEIVPFLNWVAQSPIHHVLEIGTGAGGLALLLGHIASGLVISVDLPSRYPHGMFTRRKCHERNQILLARNPRFVGILGDSTGLLPERQIGHPRRPVVDRVRRVLGKDRVDLLFIDGDHRDASVVADYTLYAPFVKPGGVIAFHDISVPTVANGVPRVWNNLKHARHSPPVEFVEPEAPWGGIGAWRAFSA